MVVDYHGMASYKRKLAKHISYKLQRLLIPDCARMFGNIYINKRLKNPPHIVYLPTYCLFTHILSIYTHIVYLPTYCLFTHILSIWPFIVYLTISFCHFIVSPFIYDSGVFKLLLNTRPSCKMNKSYLSETTILNSIQIVHGWWRLHVDQ